MQRFQALLLRVQCIQPEQNATTEITAIGVYGTPNPHNNNTPLIPTVHILEPAGVGMDLPVSYVIGRVGMCRSQNPFTYEQGLHTHIVLGVRTMPVFDGKEKFSISKPAETSINK
jgi:hypothetical protein